MMNGGFHGKGAPIAVALDRRFRKRQCVEKAGSVGFEQCADERVLVMSVPRGPAVRVA